MVSEMMKTMTGSKESPALASMLTNLRAVFAKDPTSFSAVIAEVKPNIPRKQLKTSMWKNYY